jgi:3-oxoacyl-[acyl-carrier protein] reductase
MNSDDLRMRRVLVTGGSRGIGQATALAFASAGAAVAFNYARAEDEAEAAVTLEQLRATGAPVHGMRVDVSDAAAVADMFQELRARFGGPIDVLVNNAAVSMDGLLMMLPETSWDRVLDVNLKGVFLCSKAALRGMIAARFGRIISIVSPAAFFGKEGAASYAAAKAGVVGMSKSLAREVARYGITVNTVSPGYIDTQLIADLPDATRAGFLGEIPLARFGSPGDIAGVVTFLASGAAGYMTGTTVHVDGGLTML